jgi:hypothetical protein
MTKNKQQQQKKKQYKVRTTFKLAECTSKLTVNREWARKRENFLFTCSLLDKLKGVVEHELSYHK